MTYTLWNFFKGETEMTWEDIRKELDNLVDSTDFVTKEGLINIIKTTITDDHTHLLKHYFWVRFLDINKFLDDITTGSQVFNLFNVQFELEYDGVSYYPIPK